jgi:uncharacterized zinc-type alcohol dehydrogenase-like protein
MSTANAYAAKNAKSNLAPFTFERRNVGANDVQIEILYCGVCHSDIHQARNEWGGSMYPMVPGHEIVGIVTKVGKNVKKFKAGDLAAVGCMVDSCKKCHSCDEGLEQYCENGFVGTYNGREKKTNEPTFGGYSDHIVTKESFVLKVPKNLDLAATAPLLCAGITTYSPLKHWKIKKGDNVGIIGLGGLGHMGIKFARAFGAKVTMITTSPEKAKDAKKLGAHNVLISKDAKAMEKAASSFDYLLNTIPNPHDVNPYVNLLKRDGVMTIVGCLNPLPEISPAQLILGRKTIAGSVIGGIKETQEMLNFCSKHNIVSEVEIIPMQKINEAYGRMLKSDVKYRFVIDMASLKAA